MYLIFQCKDNEFTCSDGGCIDMYYRCEGTFNCNDKSDEDNCDLLIIDREVYNKDYPPKPHQKAVEVKVYFTIDAINNIKEIDMTFSAKFTITLEWYDERLRFSNLNDGNFTNLAKPERITEIWIPPLIFNNTKKNLMITGNQGAGLFMNKMGKAMLPNHEEVYENLYFDGVENVLIYRMDMELTCACNFRLNHYPFDQQTCEIEVNTLSLNQFQSLK